MGQSSSSRASGAAWTCCHAAPLQAHTQPGQALRTTSSKHVALTLTLTQGRTSLGPSSQAGPARPASAAAACSAAWRCSAPTRARSSSARPVRAAAGHSPGCARALAASRASSSAPCPRSRGEHGWC